MANLKIEREMTLNGKQFREVKTKKNVNQISIIAHSQFINEDYHKKIKVLNNSSGKILDEKNETNMKCLDKLNSFKAEWTRHWVASVELNQTTEDFINFMTEY